MSRRHGTAAWASLIATCALVMASLAGTADAGGPLFVIDGEAVPWADGEVRGGPLDSTTVTVDEKGKRTIFYRVDIGPLGTLPNVEAVRLVDRIFGQYTDIPTADIRFENAGPIRDPETGAPLDVDDTNIGQLFDITFQNPIIFDHDGAITGPGGVLGFVGVLALRPASVFPPPNGVLEAFAVLNGRVLTTEFLGVPSFLGVFTHEFGHFAGPLDHAQINGLRAELQPGAYDLFTPFVETLYPLLFFGPPDSLFAPRGFTDSGYFIATLDRDTVNALSNLYPTREYRKTSGTIQGRVVVRSGDELIPVDGVNVIARRIDQGTYPPAADAVAFPSGPADIIVDADGIPEAPPAQEATDALATVSSAVTGMEFGHGRYRIQGLPRGKYMVHFQEIDPFFTGGSAVGPRRSFRQLTLPFFEGFYDKRTTSNISTEFTPVRIKAGERESEIDLFINGLDSSKPVHVKEQLEPHNTLATAVALPAVPALARGKVADSDPFSLRVAGIVLHDVYQFQAVQEGVHFISLESDAPSPVDLDIILLRLVGPSLRFVTATGPTAREMIGVFLTPGTYFVGVSAFSGEAAYRLRVLPPGS